jgi:hypothetical protein
MDKNFIIFIIIIIICIIIFIGYYYNNLSNNKNDKNNKQYKEGYMPWDFDKYGENKPNFVKNYENDNFDVPPNYRYENVTQYNIKRLYEVLKKVNKEKIVLKDKSNYNFYTQSTTNDKLRMDLDHISKYVILMLNSEGGNNYYNFAKTNYGDVMVWIDNIGNEEIKYELFLWDKKNYFEVKLWVHIIKFVNKQEGINYGIRDKEYRYFFPWYNIGMDFENQLIPGPLDTIITSHIDTSIDSINTNDPSKIKFLYLNQIEVQNSTLIVDYEKDMYPDPEYKVSEKGFSGVSDQSLEYINIKKNDHDPYLQKSREYNKWITLDEEPRWKGQYPSKNPVLNWNDDGVYQKDPLNKTKNDIEFTPAWNKKEDNRLCDVYEPGTRWSYEREPLQGEYYPGNYTINNNCGENAWLFERQNPDGNTFYGGGKK